MKVKKHLYTIRFDVDGQPVEIVIKSFKRSLCEEIKVLIGKIKRDSGISCESKIITKEI